jgi:hypothetical protein
MSGLDMDTLYSGLMTQKDAELVMENEQQK